MAKRAEEAAHIKHDQPNQRLTFLRQDAPLVGRDLLRRGRLDHVHGGA